MKKILSLLLGVLVAAPIHAFDVSPVTSGGDISPRNIDCNTADNRLEIDPDDDTFVVDCTNNRVGVENSAPETDFHVGDNAGSDDNEIRIQAETTQNAILNYKKGTTGEWSLYVPANSDSFRVNENGAGDRLTVAAGGNVGVNTANPAQALHVSSGTLLIDGDASTAFQVGSSSFVVKSDAVGVGNSAPETDFHVGDNSGSDDNEIRIQSETAQNAILNYKKGTTGEWSMYVPANSDTLRINENGAGDRLTVEAGGNVGIGTTDPGFTLDVSGEARVTGVSGSGKIVCVKSDGALGVCSDDPSSANGTCTCG